jgi:uncharacterized membrane protein
MNNSEENAILSFERILFFSDAVFAIVITLLVLELKAPHLAREGFTESRLLGELVGLLPKFLGFVVSFFIVGMLWIEHHRIFRYIGDYDFGLIWRNLLFLLFVAFIPFPTALFSENSHSKSAFMLYAGSFALAALGKILVWRYAVSKRTQIIVPEASDQIVRSISRRSWAVPIACGAAILLAPLAIAFGAIMFPFIPLIANFLDRKPREGAA